jgi:hypothetical protein
MLLDMWRGIDKVTLEKGDTISCNETERNGTKQNETKRNGMISFLVLVITIGILLF